jgi:hypothetical protein
MSNFIIFIMARMAAGCLSSSVKLKFQAATTVFLCVHWV